MQRDGDTVGCDVDALNQQPEDPRLLGRVELLPHRLERTVTFDDVALLGDGILSRTVLVTHRGDRARHHLGRTRVRRSDLASTSLSTSRAGSFALPALVWCNLSARRVAQALLCEPNKALAETLAVTRKETHDRENEEARVL